MPWLQAVTTNCLQFDVGLLNLIATHMDYTPGTLHALRKKDKSWYKGYSLQVVFFILHEYFYFVLN